MGACAAVRLVSGYDGMVHLIAIQRSVYPGIDRRAGRKHQDEVQQAVGLLRCDFRLPSRSRVGNGKPVILLEHALLAVSSQQKAAPPTDGAQCRGPLDRVGRTIPSY